MGGLIKHPYDAKALVVCLLRMVGGDVHTPWTREQDGRARSHAFLQYARARSHHNLLGVLLDRGNNYTQPFARQVVELAGQERQAWLMGSDNRAAASIFALSGLPVPDLGAPEDDLWNYILAKE